MPERPPEEQGVRPHSRSLEDEPTPAWNVDDEYPSLTSDKFARDFSQLEQDLAKIETLVTKLKPSLDRTLNAAPEAELESDGLVARLQEVAERVERASVLEGNLHTYIYCKRCVDGIDPIARKMQSKLEEQRARLKAATAPIDLFLARTTEQILTRYFLDEDTSAREFLIRQSRQLSETLLPENEEVLLVKMRRHSIEAWANLYNQISSRIQCRLTIGDEPPETVGLAQAVGNLRDSSEPRRKAAWHGIQEAWRAHEESCAAVLNGLAGWRIEENRRRSGRREVHYLDFPVHRARIRRETLDAMMSAVADARGIGRRAVEAMARGLGKSRIDPWDILAPARGPQGSESPRRSFQNGLALIRESFASIDPSLAEFIDTMKKNHWLEGRVLPAKRQGAFCTRFPRSRTPRVFMTYLGSISDIRTLAHELGHAYHAFVMRDLPQPLHAYPMTLAETASVFAETTFADYIAKSDDARARFEIAWQNAESAATFLLNIPSRFDFERCLYEQREKSGFVSPEELGDMTEAAWRKWYGDTISEVERQYWMTKLHFSMASPSFYNFPYTFGYLFSLSLYARRESLGSKFLPTYISILRDTGRMTAEELALRHLEEDITKPGFWESSIAIVERQVGHFESMLETTH